MAFRNARIHGRALLARTAILKILFRLMNMPSLIPISHKGCEQQAKTHKQQLRNYLKEENKLSDIFRNIKVKAKYFLNFMKYKKKFAKHCHYTDTHNQEGKLEINNIEKWNSSFERFIISQPSEIEVMKEFYAANLEIVKKIEIFTEDIIMISVVKDELYRTRKFLNHYRNIGVHKFVIIDNQSTDGTKEYLGEQHDVFLISALDKYTTNRREAWLNRVLSYFGYNRWYMVADIDELIVYRGVEEHDISDVVKFALDNNLSRIRGMMIDMYPEEYSAIDDTEDIYSLYTFFDSDTYTYEKACEFEIVRGGFRNRCMGSNALLTKYPLFFFEEGDIEGKSHFLFPYKKNWGDCYLAIKHYKFLPSDIEKYRMIAENGNYYNGSVQYKQYIKKLDDTDNPIRLIYDGTVKYEDSTSLDHIRLLKKIEWR